MHECNDGDRSFVVSRTPRILAESNQTMFLHDRQDEQISSHSGLSCTVRNDTEKSSWSVSQATFGLGSKCGDGVVLDWC
jgi:hypothetical protein